MPASLRDLIGRIIEPPARAVPPTPAGLSAIATERLETLLGWVVSPPGERLRAQGAAPLSERPTGRVSPPVAPHASDG